MLGPIRAVTMAVPDLDIIEQAYGETLGYTLVERDTISDGLAGMWNASAAAGRPCLIMQPASGAEVYLRFIECPPVPDYRPLHTYGWNANELLVEDVDSMPDRLDGSPFEIIALPRNLSTTDEIKAMQAFGPAKELTYFTTVKNLAFGLGQAESPVDRVFVVINGGASMDDHLKFYGDTLGIECAPPQMVRMSALNKIRGYDSEREHLLSTANIGGPFIIELDQYPEGTTHRPVLENDIPPGIAMVSFQVDDLSAIPVELAAPAGTPSGPPYQDGQAGVIIGPNGEWLELIEAGGT